MRDRRSALGFGDSTLFSFRCTQRSNSSYGLAIGANRMHCHHNAVWQPLVMQCGALLLIHIFGSWAFCQNVIWYSNSSSAFGGW